MIFTMTELLLYTANLNLCVFLPAQPFHSWEQGSHMCLLQKGIVCLVTQVYNTPQPYIIIV